MINKKNLYWNSLSFVILSVLGFVNFTLNLNTYDNITFGYYLLISSYWSIGASIDLGFGVSTIKNISELIKLEDHTRIKYIVNTFLGVYFVVGILISAVIFSIFFFLNENLLNDFSSNYDLKIILIFFALAFFTRYLSGFLVTVYEGLSEFVLVSKINTFLAFLNTIFTVVIYIEKLSLYYLVISQFVYGLVLFLTLLTFLIIKNKFIEYGIKYFKLDLLKKQGLYNLNIQISFTLTSFLDPIMKSILSLSLGLQYVTYFETAKKLINLSNGLIHSALKGLLNKLSEANIIGKLKEFVNDSIHVYSRLSLEYSVIVYGVLNPLICLFILVWFKNYESMMMFLIFLLPYSLINVGGPLYSILMVEGKGGKLVLLQAINVIVVSLTLFISLMVFKSFIGIIGFYFATIINSYLMIYFLIRYLGFDFRLFLANNQIKNLVLLNIGILIQIILYTFFQDYIYFLFIFFTLVYAYIFKSQLFYYSGYIYKNIITNILKIKQNEKI